MAIIYQLSHMSYGTLGPNRNLQRMKLEDTGSL
jgi:hypothetical protein